MGGSRLAFDTAPHLQDPSGTVAVWFTDPPGAVSQFVKPGKGTAELARWLVGPALATLLQRFPRDKNLRMVMDLSLMTGRDQAARAILVEATKNFKDRMTQSVLIPPQNASPVYHAALKVSVSLLRVFGVTIEIDNLTNALLTLRAAPP